jgi:2-hydroxycyclohexanecarboxyl-CoA dehydrogenase
MNLNLTDHVVAVTGGASGIGRAIAAGFFAENSRVAIWDSAAMVEQTAAQLAADFPGRVLGFRVDVADFAAVTETVRQTETALGPIEHLVHAAAIGSGKFGFPFTNLTPADWPRVLDVNVIGMVNIAHAVAPLMVERRRGTMVFVASVAGQIGSPTDPPYSASKAANINFAQCLARDMAMHGIRVNTVCPGMVETPLNESVWRAWHNRQTPDLRKTYAEWAAEKIKATTPLGRWQRPEDVADMVVFLSSQRACQITGQTINVDGGFVMHW